MKRPNVARMQKHQVRNYSEHTWRIFDKLDHDVQGEVSAWQAKFRERMLKKARASKEGSLWTIDMIIHDDPGNFTVKIELYLRRIVRAEAFSDGFLLTKEEARKEMGFA